MKLAVVTVLALGCGVDDEELGVASAELGPGWCNEAEIAVFGLPWEAGKPINVEEPFVRVAGANVYLYFSDRAPSEERDLHWAQWNGFGFSYGGQVFGINTPLGLEGAPSIDASNHFFFTNAAAPGMISRGTLYGVNLVLGAAPVAGMPAAGPRGNLFDGNMDIGVAPLHPFAILSRAAWTQPATGLPIAADLWYLQRPTPSSVAHVPLETAYFLQRLNTSALEYAPELSVDGLSIYFTRTTASPLTTAIMTARRSSLTVPFDAPTPVIPQSPGFVEGPTVMPANDRIFYHRVTPGAPTKLFTVQRC
jgi:hypothetical protein